MLLTKVTAWWSWKEGEGDSIDVRGRKPIYAPLKKEGTQWSS